MAKVIWHDLIRPGNPLWTGAWLVTIGGLTGKRKEEPGNRPALKLVKPIKHARETRTQSQPIEQPTDEKD